MPNLRDQIGDNLLVCVRFHGGIGSLDRSRCEDMFHEQSRVIRVAECSVDPQLGRDRGDHHDEEISGLDRVLDLFEVFFLDGDVDFPVRLADLLDDPGVGEMFLVIRSDFPRLRRRREVDKVARPVKGIREERDRKDAAVLGRTVFLLLPGTHGFRTTHRPISLFGVGQDGAQTRVHLGENHHAIRVHVLFLRGGAWQPRKSVNLGLVESLVAQDVGCPAQHRCGDVEGTHGAVVVVLVLCYRSPGETKRVLAKIFSQRVG